jgi:hypothetical protein
MLKALFKLLDAISNPVTVVILLALSVSLFITAGVQRATISSKNATINRMELAEAQARADAAEAQRLVGVQYRAIESRFQAQKEEAEKRDAEDRKMREARFAVVVAERDRLRQQVDTYSRGPADPAQDSIAACRHRAETLGELFGQCTERYTAVAKEADDRAAEVVKLLNAWPREEDPAQ